MRIRWTFLPLIAFLACGVVATPTATACPFCSAQGQTLSGEISQADFIVLGTLANPKRDPNDFTKGTTELLIETVVKPHDYLIGKKFITIPRYIPIDPKAADSKLLVFSNLYTRAVDTAAAGARERACDQAFIATLRLGRLHGHTGRTRGAYPRKRRCTT